MSTVTNLPVQKPDHPEDLAVPYQEPYVRIDLLEPGFSTIADYLRTGEADRGHPYAEIIDDAAALTEVLSAVDTESDQSRDACVPKACGLLHRLLSVGQNVTELEAEQGRPRDEARMERQQTERHAEANKPAGIVNSIAFITGMTDRTQALAENGIAELAEQDAVAAEIAQARLEADKDAAFYIDPPDPQEIGVEDQANTAQAHGRHLVYLGRPGNSDGPKTWIVDKDTPEILQPLEQADQGDEACTYAFSRVTSPAPAGVGPSRLHSGNNHTRREPPCAPRRSWRRCCS